MLVKELKSELDKIQKENPELIVDEMEIGPIFYNGGDVIMMVSDVSLEDSAWQKHDINGDKAIGLTWHC